MISNQKFTSGWAAHPTELVNCQEARVKLGIVLQLPQSKAKPLNSLRHEGEV